jgi:hypothetical protein
VSFPNVYELQKIMPTTCYDDTVNCKMAPKRRDRGGRRLAEGGKALPKKQGWKRNLHILSRNFRSLAHAVHTSNQNVKIKLPYDRSHYDLRGMCVITSCLQLHLSYQPMHATASAVPVNEYRKSPSYTVNSLRTFPC